MRVLFVFYHLRMIIVIIFSLLLRFLVARAPVSRLFKQNARLSLSLFRCPLAPPPPFSPGGVTLRQDKRLEHHASAVVVTII